MKKVEREALIGGATESLCDLLADLKHSRDIGLAFWRIVHQLL